MLVNLYWVTTPDGNEDWFVVAKSQILAEQFHEHAEGYDYNYAKAKLVCSISKEIYSKYQNDMEPEHWPTHELLKDLGAKILAEGNPRIVNINGQVYSEGNFTESVIYRLCSNLSGVYIIRIQNTEQYKIGMTTNLTKRIKQIKSSNPYNIKLVYFVTTEHYRSLEAHLHKIYKSYRGIGEWFHFKEEDIYELEQILLYIELEGHGLFKFYNIKKVSIHGEQY